MTQQKPTSQHFTAMGFPTPEGLAENEATAKAAGAALHETVTGINAAMHQKPSDRIASLRIIAKRLREINQIARAESLEFAAKRIDADPLDFDALRMVKITIGELAEAASRLTSAHSMTAGSLGAVTPPPPSKRPDDYEQSMQRYLDSCVAAHPIAAL